MSNKTPALLHFNSQVDGKLLCWLCTLSYKRALTKARQAESDRRRAKKRGAEGGPPPALSSSASGAGTGSRGGTGSSSASTGPLGSSANSGSRADNRSTSDKTNSSSNSSSMNRGGGSSLPPLGDVSLGPVEMPEPVPSSVESSATAGMDRVDNARNDNGRHSSSKKPRTDIKPGSEAPEKLGHHKSSHHHHHHHHSKYVDPHSSDHVIAMTQLKETIATLQRKIKQKDGIILEKEKEVCVNRFFLM